MITIAGKNLCENCFSEINSEPCPICGFSPQDNNPDPTVLSSGSVLQGRYAVGRVIGKGGFGITYLAYDTKHDEKIAVKEYYPYGIALRTPQSTIVSVSNEETADTFKNGAEKFYDEARLVAAFNGNPSIVSVYDFFYENDTVYYTMEYLEGQTLKDYVEKNGAVTSGQAVYIAERISSALMTAHSANILHRDVSPDNIMICNDGKIKLLDFGAARQVIANASQSLSVILKQGFAPLEQYQKKGRQGPWTDIYSLGATLYYALTKDIPDDPMTRFDGDDEYSSNKYSIAEPLWEIIRKATMLRIEDRYSNIFEFRSDIASSEITAEPLVEFEKPEKIVLPSGVTAKPYSSSSAVRTSAEIHNEIKTNTPPVKAEVRDTSAVPAASTEPTVPPDVPSEENISGVKKQFNKKLIAMISGAAALLITAGVIAAVGINTANSTSQVSTTSSISEIETPKREIPEDKKNYYGGDENEAGVVNNDKFIAPPEGNDVQNEVPSDEAPSDETPDEEVTDPSDTETTTTAKKEDDFVTIAGKQYKKDMTGVLDLRSSELTNNDIKQMKYLTKLNEIIISDNPKLTDLSPLAALTGLEKITFHNCNVKDISFTANMKNLSVIGGESNGISDISALSGHTKLSDVWLQNNNVKDISPLKDSTEMINICFYNNPVSDLSVLSGMKKLKQINFTGCNLKSIDALKKCTTIELAYLSENRISDLTPLANCKQLKELYAASNALNGNVKALKGLTILDILDVSDNNYDDDELYEYLCYEVFSDEDSFSYYY